MLYRSRKGRDAVDTTGLELDKEYWQPVTMMIEVAYGREEIMNCIRRWCKPADEVRKYMEDTMKRCQRAPESYLALRLPFKSTALPESEDVSKEATPVVDEKAKAKPGTKYVKKATTPAAKAAAPSAKKANESPANLANGAPKATEPMAAAAVVAADATEAKKESDAAPPATDSAQTESAEGGRPRRATRKSVRISEG